MSIDMTPILDRMPATWGKYIACPPAWFPKLLELDAAVAALIPEYVVYQCKIKFNGLRYYVEYPEGTPVNRVRQANRLIQKAEDASYRWSTQ